MTRWITWRDVTDTWCDVTDTWCDVTGRWSARHREKKTRGGDFSPAGLGITVDVGSFHVFLKQISG